MLVVIATDSPATSDPSAGFVDDVPSTTPSNLGDIDLTELQYGDPVEALGLIQPPKAGPDGSAGLAHPLPVPPGRAGVEPDLALSYDSAGGSGWVGTGWDLSAGAVTVDTAFGAPRYLGAKESETYQLDGDRLFPNAIRTDLQDRPAGPRSDWVRELEDAHDLIVRHGDTPSTYCWQVADKKGNHRWYGGTPNDEGGCDRDESAILTAPATGAPGGVSGDFHWALTYVQDISGNTMRFAYDEVTGVPMGRETSSFGVSLHLREIAYTGFALDTAPDHPAYRVRFLRDGDVTGATRRLDVSIDAGAGLPVVTRDLLRGVEVEYLSPEFHTAGASPQRVKGWTLEYENGPYDKSLLTSVGQYGAGGRGTEHAWHRFTWFDEVRDPTTGEYRGFGDIEQWGNSTDTSRVNIAAESALGTSYRGGADGGAYIGFNPAIPNKIGSFGGSFNIAGGQTNEASTLVDLDGDSLADKVWVTDNGTVMYRPNLNRPGATDASKYGSSWFGEAQTISGINSLGQSSDLKVNVHFEAYPVVAIQVGGGFGFSFGDRYFADANGDGRVDFVKPGAGGAHTVFYNVLVGGVPTFIDSSLASELSDKLEVPLDAFDSSAATESIAEVAELLVNTSPRIDTVRRWIAPHSGTVRVEGAPTLRPGSPDRGDGALVTVEHGGAKRWERTLTKAAPTAAHDETFDLTAGQSVWFRLHVIQNAADDVVDWAPKISYTNFPAPVADDANGRSQIAFDAAADFTLFGRSGARTALAEPGQMTVNVKATTHSPLSDDLRVAVLRGRGRGAATTEKVLTVPQRTAGVHSDAVDLTITAPSTNVGGDGTADTSDDYDESDWLEVRVDSDSPVDPTKYSIELTTSAPAPEAPGVSDIPPGNPATCSPTPPQDACPAFTVPLDLPLVPNVQVFSRTDHTEPYRPIRAPASSTGRVDVVVDGPAVGGGDPSITSRAALTVKTLAGGVQARKAFTISNGPGGLSGSATLDFPAAGGTDYYLDVSVADPVVGAAANLRTSAVSFDGGTSETNGQLHWPDVDGVFPSGNRGWAFAGYNADHADSAGSGPLVESQFRFTAASSGYDEDTAVPTASEAPSAAEVKAGARSGFDPALPYIPWAGPGSDVADRWRAGSKETLHGKGSSMQADRLGADIALGSPAVTGRAAPQILGLDGDFNFMLGLIASFSAAAGGGRALKDFEDYNGDGLPDIRSGSTIEYTGPRGAKAATTGAGGDSFDTGIGVEVGLGGSPLNISSTGGANKNDDGGGAGSNVEPTSTKSSRGLKIGLGFGLGFQWTNPVVGSEAFTEAAGGGGDAPDVLADQASVSGTVIDRSMIDMNGDGLPDRVDTYTNGEVLVSLNLGYRFAGEAVKWSTGRTSANQDVGGSVSLGFQLNAYEFAGGVAYSEAVGFSLFDWMDVDGDGVPDRMDNSGGGDPLTVFGSGDGMQRPERDYGTYFKGNVAVDADRWQEQRDDDGNLRGVDLPDGQMEVSRSTSLTGGADFSFYIGPICLVACYIVVNPGVHGGYDRMTSQVQMVDVNGDGALDAVRSTDYEHLEVRLNRRGRTNMLQSVTNPLGGQIRMDYQRTGNTRENPESLWVLSSVEFDDGRSGDGPDVQRSEFSYDGNVWDRLLREQLGFSTVREDQVDLGGAGGTRRVLRSYERDYLNGNPLESGLLVEERLLDGAGTKVQASSFEWSFANANPHGGLHGPHGDPVVGLPEVHQPARTLLFDTALSPRLDRESLTHWDAEGHRQLVRTRYTYNTIGDVLTVHDENEDEVDADDTFTVLTYSECATRNGDRAGVDSWVSVPATVTVFGNDEASGEIMKYRNGGPGLCANSVPLRIAEMVDAGVGNPCGRLYAITELSFDTHGSYDAVAHPSNVRPGSCADHPPATVAPDDLAFEGCGTLTPEDSAVRYCLDYVYDDHRRTDIGLVTDNHGVSSSATYDPLTGRLASRTDENDNLTTYGYDPQGRLASVTAPREQGSGTPTVSYSYGGLDATLDHAGAHSWSTSHHHDVFNAGNAIDTATFVDGMGRTVQRKRDAQVDGVAGEARTVEGAIEYDALGHEVKEWYPVVEKVGAQPLTTYNAATSESGPATTGVPLTKPTVRTFTVLDQLTSRTLPDDSVERFAYDFDVLPDPLDAYTAPIVMSRVVTTDALGRTSSRWVDVGGAVFFRQEDALGANDPDGTGGPLAALPTGTTIGDPRITASTGTPGAIETLHEYDRLGRLTATVDAAGARTTHAYDPMDNVTATSTPDSGLVQRTFAPSGQLLTVERARGTVATYAYDRDRMVGVSYSDHTPPVGYQYGDDAAAENGAGRVTSVADGAMTRAYGYDVDGNVARETATRHPDPFGKGVDPDPATWETAWDYDSLGRVALLVYPDGEALTHDYDLGGRPESLVSQAPQHDLYDQYGIRVPRPDVEITYVGEVRYDQFGQATYLRTGSGVETSYTHDPERRFLAGVTTDSTAAEQYDGSTAVARPLQRLEYTYDQVGNARDVVNRLYAEPTDTTVADLGPAPVNNVPGPSQHAYTYDGHYRLTGGAGTYIDQKERRDFTFEADYAPNGNLLSKRQVTTTTSTTSKGGKTTTTTGAGTGNGKKGDGSGTGGGTTTEDTCESNTGSGGGSFNQDPETTYVIAPGDLAYATDSDGHQLHRITRSGTRDYTHDANGNMTGWVQPCAGGTSTITRTIEWDAENRVTRLAEGNNDTVYRYSAEGHRTLERGPQGTTWFINEHWRTFNDGLRYANVFLGQQMIASHRTDPQPPPPPACTDTPEVPCPCEQDGACEVAEAECDPAGRVYDATTGTCQPKETRTIHFLHKDLQGSLRVATDEVGVVFQYVDYLPTGRPWVAGQSTTKDTPYLFAGGWTDTTYDLVNFGERWYDAREQNFLSAEPLLEESPYAAVDDPSLLSAYTYAASNPLRYVDPDGRAPRFASNGFDLGDELTHEKHESGNISVPVASREARAAPAITFGGRYSNDAAGQALVQKMVDREAKIQRFATLLNIATEDGERKVHVFGKLVDKRKVGDHAAPDPGPSDTGAKPDDGLPAPPDPSGTPDPPGADDAGSGSDDGPSSSRSGATDGAGDAGAGAPSPDAGSGSNDGGEGGGPSTAPPLPPRPASPSAGGDSDVDRS
ncbi:MAG: SpvB/TcaC N-terminal domain-containing protein [Acidimicrobiales bacterium]